MARVYSTKLFSGAVSSDEPLSYIVGATLVVVVRDICAWPPDVEVNPPPDLSIVDYPASSPWAGWVAPYVQTRRFYHWEGRQVFEAGEGFSSITSASAENPWVVRVSGFVLGA